jgi:hypothetical protein
MCDLLAELMLFRHSTHDPKMKFSITAGTASARCRLNGDGHRLCALVAVGVKVDEELVRRQIVPHRQLKHLNGTAKLQRF